MNKNLPLHLTQATIKCAFLRDKKVIIIIIIIIIINIIKQPEPVSWFEMISLIRTCSN